MHKDKHKPEDKHKPGDEAVGAEAGPLDQADGGALVEPAPAAVARLETEVGEARLALAQAADKYLRLAAEFDNFRKRSVRERTEARARGQADLLERLVDALDDLSRFAHVDPAQTDAKTIHDGVDMVERKVWKELESLGVGRIDQIGVPFDPHQHEAVTMRPAENEAQDHTVGAVLQQGYKLGDALIRPARVIVLTWQGDAGEAAQTSPRPPADS